VNEQERVFDVIVRTSDVVVMTRPPEAWRELVLETDGLSLTSARIENGRLRYELDLDPTELSLTTSIETPATRDVVSVFREGPTGRPELVGARTIRPGDRWDVWLGPRATSVGVTRPAPAQPQALRARRPWEWIAGALLALVSIGVLFRARRARR